MCSIAGCDAKPVAKGLCARHYMRACRTGDPAKTRKPGPKPAPNLAAQLFDDWSPRSQARWTKALKLRQKLKEIFGEDCFERANQAATRQNGTLNISAFLEQIEGRAALMIARLPR
jgi:hypothetical protein